MDGEKDVTLKVSRRYFDNTKMSYFATIANIKNNDKLMFGAISKQPNVNTLSLHMFIEDSKNDQTIKKMSSSQKE